MGGIPGKLLKYYIPMHKGQGHKVRMKRQYPKGPLGISMGGAPGKLLKLDEGEWPNMRGKRPMGAEIWLQDEQLIYFK